MKVFNDTEDIRTIADLEDYAVLLDTGITLKEGLQNRQDACIKINVLFNQNIWATLKLSKEFLQDNENMFIEFLNEIKKNIIDISFLSSISCNIIFVIFINDLFSNFIHW